MDHIKNRNQKRERRAIRNRAKIFGTATKPRLSVFVSNKQKYAQLINDDAGVTIAASRSKKAAEVGKDIATQAKKAGITQAVFNRGHYKYHGNVKAIAEAARKTGLKV